MKGKESTPFLDFTGGQYSYYLDSDMLDILAGEFDPEKLADRVAEAEQKAGDVARVCRDYGADLAKRVLELGRQKTDRTGEVIEQAGIWRFPHLSQRFLEIAYLSIQPVDKLDVTESNLRRLAYRVAPCTVFDSLKARCSNRTLKSLPCKHACLALNETLYSALGMKTKVTMEAALTKEGHCEFAARTVP